jgi:16S rRNA (uracil1498-N3)-methyltransferase
MHRAIVESISWSAGETAIVLGDEAHHALRVKRVRAGEPIELLDGRGRVASGEVLESHAARHTRDLALHIRIAGVRDVPEPSPRVEVWSAVPKAGRADEMIDQLAQVGAAAWRPLDTARAITDPREHKLDRLNRIAAEASKQCGRAWTMAIGPKATFEQALQGDEHTHIIVADATGVSVPLPRASVGRPLPRSSGGGAGATATAEGVVRLLIGPEGGFTEQELHTARTAGAHIHRFGPHIMRIETAAVVACAAFTAR